MGRETWWASAISPYSSWPTLCPPQADNRGTTPLHHAQFADTIELLLQHGADPLQQDNAGQSPYSLAKAREDKVAMRYASLALPPSNTWWRFRAAPDGRALTYVRRYRLFKKKMDSSPTAGGGGGSTALKATSTLPKASDPPASDSKPTVRTRSTFSRAEVALFSVQSQCLPQAEASCCNRSHGGEI